MFWEFVLTFLFSKLSRHVCREEREREIRNMQVVFFAALIINLSLANSNHCQCPGGNIYTTICCCLAKQELDKYIHKERQTPSFLFWIMVFWPNGENHLSNVCCSFGLLGLCVGGQQLLTVNSKELFESAMKSLRKDGKITWLLFTLSLTKILIWDNLK